MKSDFLLKCKQWREYPFILNTGTVLLFAGEQGFGRSLMMSRCAPTVKLPRAVLRGEERSCTAYAGMDLQPSAKDCIRLWHGGREGMKRIRVGGKRVRRTEQALLGDHQTGRLMKADIRKVLSYLI